MSEASKPCCSKKIFKSIGVAVATTLIMILSFAAMQPSKFYVERSITIAAPAAKIFPLVNTQRAWDQWSPWAKLDPNASFTFEGPDAGVGSISRWAGNMEVGEGSSEIIESRPNEYIKMQLEFIKPMQGTNLAEFGFKPEGEQTVVRWSMSGHSNFMAKLVGLFMDCEAMVGGQFEQGLANLKAIAEAK